MSTDLHLHHNLPKLRISPIKMENTSRIHSPNQNDAVTVVEERPEAVTDRNDGGAVVLSVVEVEQEEEEEESYRTPTSKESKIPEMVTCPPAPKKAKAIASCKRKLLDEFQFFDVNNKEDMDAFFRSTFPKRTCSCT
ncbi:cyclin-dependent protein kinase inhibitor SMR1-like [Arachis stenosperma]|uniref:cyclin-dependent protein kinase inhibitor SMR1-like n=1 Tax=Arachis stenosperma TaxID=217475 RepID=UPI0025AC83D7|nr:cyclin-dependent protein kinase inhibitor SMR1-like [Arachis stenosperma]